MLQVAQGEAPPTVLKTEGFLLKSGGVVSNGLPAREQSLGAQGDLKSLTLNLSSLQNAFPEFWRVGGNLTLYHY